MACRFDVCLVGCFVFAQVIPARRLQLLSRRMDAQEQIPSSPHSRSGQPPVPEDMVLPDAEQAGLPPIDDSERVGLGALAMDPPPDLECLAVQQLGLAGGAVGVKVKVVGIVEALVPDDQIVAPRADITDRNGRILADLPLTAAVVVLVLLILINILAQVICALLDQGLELRGIATMSDPPSSASLRDAAIAQADAYYLDDGHAYGCAETNDNGTGRPDAGGIGFHRGRTRNRAGYPVAIAPCALSASRKSCSA